MAVVGFDLQTRMGAPWNVVSGNIDDLRQPDSVFIDEIYRTRLGNPRVGDIVEIQGRRARIAGYTRGILSFTVTPYIFTRFKAAQDYTVLREDETGYLLVKAEPGVDVEALRQRLAARLPSVDVLTAEEFSRRTRMFWMFTTGAGLAVLLAAVLGLVVGVVIVAQTIYATTMDHIREYATLKAMGADNRYLYKVIVQQAVISALIGYPLGIGDRPARHPRQQGERPRHPAAAGDGRGHAGRDAGDVRERRDVLDPQDDAPRSGDGVQGVRT